MIVTCPGCSSKYRVKNDVVPPDGAKMRCPKCETLFLAMLPAGKDARFDDPSSIEPLAPASVAMPPAPPPKANVPGPVTSLFQAFDSSALPQEMQRPPPQQQPSGPPKPRPSGLELDTGPKIHVPMLPTREAPKGVKQIAGRAPPSIGQIVASWVALGVALFGALCGVAYASWTTEKLDLDATLMPTLERVLHVEPPRSFIGRGESSVDDLKNEARALDNAGDSAGAAIAWKRVRAKSPGDTAAGEALKRLGAPR